jgi:hypothetical protein
MIRTLSDSSLTMRENDFDINRKLDLSRYIIPISDLTYSNLTKYTEKYTHYNQNQVISPKNIVQFNLPQKFELKKASNVTVKVGTHGDSNTGRVNHQKHVQKRILIY